MEDYRCWDAHVTAAQEISLLMILESPYCGFLISFLSHARSYPPLLFIYLQTYGRNPRIDAIFWKTIAQGRGIDALWLLQSSNANEICSFWREKRILIYSEILYLQILFTILNIYRIVFLRKLKLCNFSSIIMLTKHSLI